MNASKGEFIASAPKFGYQKEKDEIHKLVIDPKGVKVVRMIFDYVA